MNVLHLFDLGKYIAPKSPDRILEEVCMGRLLNPPSPSPLPFLCPAILGIGQEKAIEIKLEQEKTIKNVESPFGHSSLFAAHEIRIFSRFPARQMIGPTTTTSAFIKDLDLIDSKQVLNNHKFKIIEFFDESQIKTIKQYTEEYGAITLIIEEQAAMVSAINSITSIKNAFNYCCFMNVKNANPDHSADDLPALFISFIDLPYAIPIFNDKKVNGIGVRMGLYWPKLTESSHKLTPIYEIYFIVSMFEENIFYIDGKTLNKPGMDDKSQKELFMFNLEQSLKPQKEKSLKQKKATKDNLTIDVGTYNMSAKYYTVSGTYGTISTSSN